MDSSFTSLQLDQTTPSDPDLQRKLETMDAEIRKRHGLSEQQSAAGVLDLRSGRLAMVRPDRLDYAASIPKVAILLAYFALQPELAENLEPNTQQELGEMIKTSSNEMAAKYSQLLGLKNIQGVLAAYNFYDPTQGGGIWVGKHYGLSSERYGDPIANHSHAATVRQLLRFYLLLEQQKLVSPAASRKMRAIFASPQIPHRNDKFVRGLSGRNVEILRKAGWWEDWSHDSAIVTGPGRHYIMVAMTRHPAGENYLQEFAAAVDDLLISEPLPNPLQAKR